VGAGLWGSTLEIEDRIPTGDTVQPKIDEQSRAAAHAEWRAFVERAAEL
jgi:glycerol kinase